MIEKRCDLWLEPAAYRCFPTSGAVNDEGEAILDSSVAKQAADKYSGLSTDLGRLITSRGNHVHEIRGGVLSFPVKQYQWAGPSLQVIERSARELMAIVGDEKTLLARPGCGPGELEWEKVAGVLSFLPDNIIVIEHT